MISRTSSAEIPGGPCKGAMKTSDFVVFISVVLLIYISVHSYLFIRGWQALPDSAALRIPYAFLFFFFATSYIAGRVTEHISVCTFSKVLIWTGSFWLAMILYLLLFVLFFDLLRAGDYFFKFFPVWAGERYGTVKIAAFLFAVTASLALVFAGHINSIHPRIQKLNLEIGKNAGTLRNLKIVMATDIHLGTIISNSRVRTLVDAINSCNPDVVLLGGDIVDEDLKPVIEMNLGEQLRQIRSKYGTFAITGNHEYIGGAEAACRYMEEHGITVLRDAHTVIGGSVVLAGREDLTKNRFTGVRRKSLAAILNGVDRKRPIICMDHQPFHLEEAAENGVDIQLSGHTHNGQLWPLNFIVALIYQVGYGYARIENTHYYVSTGFGTWGPPVRTGNRPEIVEIMLTFRE